MDLDIRHTDYPSHNRWLAGYCFLTYAVTLILLYAGGFTTTIGAGMVFPDWPFSNGSLNPPGWTTDEAMLAEHSHRLLGMTLGTLCIGLVFMLWRLEPRRWVRLLGYGALGFVVFQGVLGGMRVLFVSIDLAKVHGVTAQLFLCLLTAVAIASSRWFKNLSVPRSESDDSRWKSFRLVGLVLCGMTIVQLVVGAIIRHRGAGMAVPYFPHAAVDGSFLPYAWNWATSLHMAHRGMALLLYVGLLGWLFRQWAMPNLPKALRNLGIVAAVLIHIQIYLGASVIWSGRQPIQTTLHVLNGALFLSSLWGLTFAYFKPVVLGLEQKAPATKSASMQSPKSVALSR